MAAKILAVDDQPSIVKLVSTTLTNRGYRVIEAYDGEDAVDRATLDKPDLIVLDVMMPKMSGLEVRDKLASDPRTAKIPILFLSAIGDFEGQLDTLESGPGHYLTKPFKPSELADYVAAMLDPDRKAELDKQRSHQIGKLRAVVEIMREKREQG